MAVRTVSGHRCTSLTHFPDGACRSSSCPWQLVLPVRKNEVQLVKKKTSFKTIQHTGTETARERRTFAVEADRTADDPIHPAIPRHRRHRHARQAFASSSPRHRAWLRV